MHGRSKFCHKMTLSMGQVVHISVSVAFRSSDISTQPPGCGSRAPEHQRCTSIALYLRKLVAQKVWLSRDYLYLCRSVHPYTKTHTLKNKSSTITKGTCHIGHPYHNWQLSKQGIRWPVSCAHIGDQVLGFRLDCRHKPGFNSGEDRGRTCKGKILA